MAGIKRKKVLLVNYAGYFVCANTFIPDNSLGTLAAMLRRHGVPVEILDLQAPRAVGAVMDHTTRHAARSLMYQLEAGITPSDGLIGRYHEERRVGQQWLVAQATEQLLHKVAEEHVSLVGFKLWAGEGILGAIHMAEAIRAAFPHVTLVAGGPAVQYCGEQLREITQVFDYLVAGEGEYAIVELACPQQVDSSSCAEGAPALPADLGQIVREAMARKGLWTLRRTSSGGIPRAANLDDLPFPTYDNEIYPDIGDFYRLRVLDESRGCFNQCAFCAHSHLSGQSTRKRHAASVVDEMERLQRDQKVSYFRLSGSNPPWKLVARIAKEILRRGLRVSYSTFASMNNVNPEIFGLLRESGLRSIFFGVESADHDLLWRAHHKSNGSQQYVAQVCETAMRHDIFAVLSFIVPSPFETEATKRASLDLIGRIFARRHHGSVMAGPAFLTPYTRWWDEMDRFGFRFAPGVDRRSYVLKGVRLGGDYLLPRSSWADSGYLLNGRSMPELLAECEAFAQSVERLGVPTYIDDTAYLLALMGNLEPRAYKARALAKLIVGGADDIRHHVQEINRTAESTKEPSWPRRRVQSNAA